MALDALLAVAIVPAERYHFPLAVRFHFPLGLERHVEMDEAFVVGDPPVMKAAAVAVLDFQLDRQIGDLVRGELRQHGAHRAQPSAPVETGTRSAQRPGRNDQPLAVAIAEIGLDADGLGGEQSHRTALAGRFSAG